MKKQKIAVIGGTGKAGQYLVRELSAQGFPTRLLVRDPQKLQNPLHLSEIVVGDVSDAETVKSLLEGCGAVVSALGLGVPNSATDIFSISTNHILNAMHDVGISRYLVITGLNVDTALDQKSASTQAKTDWMKTHFPATTADKQKEYETLRGSTADWTLVRLPMIELTDAIHEVKACLLDCPGEKIGAGDLARFLVAQLASGDYVRQTPFIANV